MHLFSLTNLYDVIYKWFNILINKGNELEVFVSMPNHLHLLIYVNENENINKLLANGKRFLAYEIVKRLLCKSNMQSWNNFSLRLQQKKKNDKKT